MHSGLIIPAAHLCCYWLHSNTMGNTIPWLDHIKAIARKMGFDSLEIGMSKPKGMALCNVSVISKEGNLLYFWFCKLLIEHYSNVAYMSDALKAYANLMQGENETVTQYLARAKVLLECIHHTSKLCDITGSSYDNLYFSKDCIHHMFKEGLHPNRTVRGQWKMSSK